MRCLRHSSGHSFDVAGLSYGSLVLRRSLAILVVIVVGVTVTSTSHADQEAVAGSHDDRPVAFPDVAPAANLRFDVEPIEDFRYDPLVLKGRAADICSGGLGSGTARTFNAIVSRFGGVPGTMYACRERWDVFNNPDCNGTVVNPATNPNFYSTCWSNHAQGRALDVMVGTFGGGYNTARGISIVNWLLAPDVHNSTNSNARRLGVQQILFNNRCWNSDGDRGIMTWAAMRPCGVGHQNHVHIDMTLAGASGQVSYWGATPAPLTPKPDTQVLWDRDSFWREAVSWWNLGARTEEGLALPPGFDRAITGDWDADGVQDEIMLWDNDSGAYFLQTWRAGDALNARMGSWSPVYDEVLAGDWDRDGQVDDMMLWDQDSGLWVLQSWSDFENTYRGRGTWSLVYDKIIVGDFDGDGFVNDMMLWDQDSGLWVLQSWSSFRNTYRGRGTWSRIYDEIIVGDFDAGGDLDEIILWDRDSGLWVMQSWANFHNTYRGVGYWTPTIRVAAPGDYDADGRMDDLFLYDPTSGRWTINSYHRYLPSYRTSGSWEPGFDLISVGSFSEAASF